MHPVNSQNFGPNGIGCSFNNGSSTVSGYIVRQLGLTKYYVTADGVNFFVCSLAQTDAAATSLQPGFMTIPIGSSHVARLLSRQAFTTDGTMQYWTIATSQSGPTALIATSEPSDIYYG